MNKKFFLWFILAFTMISMISFGQTPLDGATNVSVNATFDWPATPTATEYWIDILNDVGTAIVSTSTGVAITYNVLPNVLTYGKVYTWRPAYNIGGIWTYYGAYQTFTTVGEIPTLGFSPPTPTLNVALNSSLTWTAVAGASGYHIDVSVDPLFGTTLYSTNVGASQLTGTNFAYATKYYWRVQSLYASGAISDFSAVQNFTTLGEVPVLATPLNGATGVSIDINLVWGAVPAIANYHFQFSTSPTFATTLFDVDVAAGTTNFALLQLLNSTNYYWRVKSVYANGVNSAYASHSFTTIPEYLPVQGWPIGGASVYTRTPLLSWYHNINVPVLWYDVLLSTNVAMTSPVIYANNTTTTFTLPTLLSGTMYYWQVRSKLPSGVISKYSVVESFFVDGTPGGGPLAPQLSYPAGGELIYTPTVSLNWWINGGSANYSYNVEVSTTNLFTVGPNTWSYPVATGTSFSFTIPVMGVQYFWRVNSILGGLSTISATGNFATYAPSPVALIPVLSWPVGGATVYTAAPTFYWYVNGNGTGLTYYGQVSTVNTFASGVQSFTSITTSFDGSGLTLTPGVPYYWRVSSSSATGPWATYESFVLNSTSTSPVVPVCSYPVSNATVYADNVTLYWYSNSAVPSGTLYEVEYTTGSTTITTSLTANNYVAITGLTAGAAYTWKVRSKIGSGSFGAYSATETFTTISGTSNVAVPVLSWPIGGAMVYSTSQNLSWYMNGASTGLSFRLKWSYNSLFTGATPINGVTSGYQITGLTPGATVYWAVESYVGSSNSGYCTTGSFVVNDPSAIYSPLVGGPTGGVNVSPSNAVVSWAVPASIGSNKFEVTVSDNSNFANSTVISNLTANSLPLSGLTSGKNYFWKVRTSNGNGTFSTYSTPGFFTTNGPTGVGEEKVIPTSFSVDQNYPNPFNPTTLIRFAIPTEGMVTLKIYSVLGQEVRTLIANQMQAGTYDYEWNAMDNSGKKVESGVYILRVTAGENVAVKKMILLK